MSKLLSVTKVELMVYRKKSLRPMEEAFVEASRQGHEPIAAAALAGYRDPYQMARRLMLSDFVGPAARDAAREYLRQEGAAIAVGGLAVIALDERQPAGARVSAMRELAKLSGIAGDERDGKDPAEMTLEELR